eukprot:364892-Chlamydomonas_euryale.AAC.10
MPGRLFEAHWRGAVASLIGFRTNRTPFLRQPSGLRPRPTFHLSATMRATRRRCLAAALLLCSSAAASPKCSTHVRCSLAAAACAAASAARRSKHPQTLLTPPLLPMPPPPPPPTLVGSRDCGGAACGGPRRRPTYECDVLAIAPAAWGWYAPSGSAPCAAGLGPHCRGCRRTQAQRQRRVQPRQALLLSRLVSR